MPCLLNQHWILGFLDLNVQLPFSLQHELCSENVVSLSPESHLVSCLSRHGGYSHEIPFGQRRLECLVQ